MVRLKPLHFRGFALLGHMEKQQKEMKWKLETEIGIINTQSLMQLFLHGLSSSGLTSAHVTSNFAI